MQNKPAAAITHCQGTNATTGTAATPQTIEEEREKLRGALVLTQESAAVQILLEACLMKEHEKVGD